MFIIIPIIDALLYRMGGMDQWTWCPINQKLWRWLGIGLFTGIVCAIIKHSWIPLLAIATYAIAIQAFPYGDKSWVTKLFGRWVSMGLAGLTYGLASIVILTWWVALIQAVVGCVAFLVIKYFDDKGVIHNPVVELARGFLGTVLMVVL